MIESPLVVFVPVSGEVVLSDLTLYVDRVRQMAVDLSTGQVTIEQCSNSDSESTSNEQSNSDYISNPNHDVSENSALLTSTSPLSRFQEDINFDRDKCLRLHREIQEQQFEYELQIEAQERKKARIEEIRLGLISEDTITDSVETGLPNELQKPHVPVKSSISDSFPSDQTIDFYTSVMFAFHDSGTFSYFHAASGLAPPQFCPDDSDDEKPFDIVQQEQRQMERKRKNAES